MANTNAPLDSLEHLREKVETLAVQVVTAQDAAVPCRTLEEIRAELPMLRRLGKDLRMSNWKVSVTSTG
jgi:hypothetical protein